jgi:hypothetical protein
MSGPACAPVRVSGKQRMATREHTAQAESGFSGGKPRRKDPVWRLIERERAWPIQVLSPIFLLVLFSIGCWFALWDAERALSLGGALILQMFFHEFGHLFVFRRNGVRSRIWWLFPLGAVAAPVDDAAKAGSDLLPWNSTARLLQAGETANVGWRCIGSLMQDVAIGWLTAFGGNLLLAGGILAVSNLVPL